MFHFLKHINQKPDYVIADNPNDKDFILALHKERWEINSVKKNHYELAHNDVKVLVKLNDNDWKTNPGPDKVYHQNFQVKSKKPQNATIFMYPQNTSSFLLDKPTNFDPNRNQYFPKTIWRRAYDVPHILSQADILKSWRCMRSPYLHKYASWLGKLGSIVIDEYNLGPSNSIKADPKSNILFVKRQGRPKSDALIMLEKAWKMAIWRGLSPSGPQGTILCSNMILVQVLPNMTMHQKLKYYDEVLNDPVIEEMEKFYNKSK